MRRRHATETGASIPQGLARHAPKSGQGEAIAADPIPTYLSALLRAYIASQRFASLSPETRRSYLECSRPLHREVGDLCVWNMTVPDFRRYMDERPPVRANRERSLLISAWKWGRERGLTPIHCVPEMVRPYPEKPRTRYITDPEFSDLLCYLAWRWTPGCLAAQLAYSLAGRLADVLRISRVDCQPDGILLRQRKTGRVQLKAWAPGLVTFLRSAPLGKNFLVEGERSGRPYTPSGFKSQWCKIVDADFTFHDIKAKAVSDFEGDKRLFSGHSDQRMVWRVYNRRPERSQALDFMDDNRNHNPGLYRLSYAHQNNDLDQLLHALDKILSGHETTQTREQSQ